MLALLGPGNTLVRFERNERVDVNAPRKTGYRWVPVVDELVDNTTAGNQYIVTSDVVQTVETNRVLRRITKRDMTAAEIDAAKTANSDSLSTQELGRILLSMYRVLFAIAKQQNASLTPAQFRTFITNATSATDITDTAFRQWLKERL